MRGVRIDCEFDRGLRIDAVKKKLDRIMSPIGAVAAVPVASTAPPCIERASPYPADNGSPGRKARQFQPGGQSLECDALLITGRSPVAGYRCAGAVTITWDENYADRRDVDNSLKAALGSTQLWRYSSQPGRVFEALCPPLNSLAAPPSARDFLSNQASYFPE